MSGNPSLVPGVLDPRFGEVAYRPPYGIIPHRLNHSAAMVAERDARERSLIAPWRDGGRRLTTLMLVMASGGTACREAGLGAACPPSPGVEVWVERRFPSTVKLADSAFASLSLSIARDSTARLPAGSMISAVIAGPAAPPLPDTVRVLSAEPSSGAALWRGDQLRAGEYTAELVTAGYAAGPHSFLLAPGERVEIEARLHHTACTGDSARGSKGREPR